MNVPVGQVPIAPVARLMKKWGAQNGVVTHLHSKRSDSEHWVGHLARLSSTSERTISRLVNEGVMTYRDGPRYWMTFNLADRILTAMDYTMEWHTNEDLAPHYGPLPVTRHELEEGYEIPEGFNPLFWQKALIRRREIALERQAA